MTTTNLFNQRLTDEQRQEVLAWFPELHYDDSEPGNEGFYDHETARFHRDWWFVEKNSLVDRETVHLCILEKNRWMVDVGYTCPECDNSWLDTYIRVPQDTSQPYQPQGLHCDHCGEQVAVTHLRDFFQQRATR